LTDRELFIQAQDAMQYAYAPYSRYSVGAAVLTGTGEIFRGANIENASYGATLCAERVAISSAVFAGHKDDLIAIAICASSGEAVYPCGICRQFLFEFGADIRVITGKTVEALEIFPISELLPNGFRLENK
jgi:cytidine deaminase